MEITTQSHYSLVQTVMKEASFIKVYITEIYNLQFVKSYFLSSSVLHSGFLDPLNHTDNKEYWSGPYMNDLLNFMGIAQNSVVRNSLENEYFYDWQIGSQEDMTPGLVDVSLLDQIYLFLSTSFLSVWRCIYAQGPRVPNG